MNEASHSPGVDKVTRAATNHQSAVTVGLRQGCIVVFAIEANLAGVQHSRQGTVKVTSIDCTAKDGDTRWLRGTDLALDVLRRCHDHPYCIPRARREPHPTRLGRGPGDANGHRFSMISGTAFAGSSFSGILVVTISVTDFCSK